MSRRRLENVLKIIIDAGHGGNDIGDIYMNRFEKDDTLKLSLALGELLENKYGYDVVYTRTEDVYLSQLDRAKIINNSGGDLVLSIHRVIGSNPLTRDKGQTYFVTEYGGLEEEVARNIAERLYYLSNNPYMITIRSDIPVLRDTVIPSVMAEIGNIDSEKNNKLFDENLDVLVEAIALGIAESFQEKCEIHDPSLPMDCREEGRREELNLNQEKMEEVKFMVNSNQKRYRIQVGLFFNYENALNTLTRLFRDGYPAEMQRIKGLYAILVGDFANMDDAVNLETRLRRDGYNTLLISY